MRNILAAPAASFAQGWVNFYTDGLPPDVRDGRRDEIASDVWEQTHDTPLEGAGSRGIPLHMLMRTFIGMPSDFSWRRAEGKLAGNAADTDNDIERGKTMRFVQLVTRPKSYFNWLAVLLGMLVLFPIGIAAFVGAVVGTVVPFTFLAMPVVYRYTEVQLGPMLVDTMGEALLVSLLGLIMISALLILTNTVTGVFGKFVSIRVGRVQLGEPLS